ncbi:hypothetical protein HPP92_023481 [Vanilla planifolia]|uniref:Peptidase A1 domain-containing protein n=1 Tax=Vanilla planifolia TaxID=51239 RepID=A0A835PVE6_VANPL|nr:hypothetical protein HPP92_023481 [Vanilla planifolia]
MDARQLTGVVIISLPPGDDPSKGKTITAFTVSDDCDHLPSSPPTAASSSAPSSAAVIHRSRVSPKVKKNVAAAALSLSLIFFFIWSGLFAEAPVQLLSGNEGDGRPRRSSFVLPLYSKNGDTGGNGTFRLVTSVKVAVSSKSSSSVIPIRGSLLPDGQYYTAIYVGNPPRPYFLDVDTGSDLTWIQCDAPCISCTKGPHSWYKPSKSKIVEPWDSLCQEIQRNQNHWSCDLCQQCDYEIEYADRSSSVGVLARDEMHLMMSNGDRSKVNFVFGCAYDQQGQFLSSAKTDGILGLSNAKVGIPSQLASQGVINNVLGHCIAGGAKNGGYMFFGDEFVPRWGITWIPLQSGLMNNYGKDVAKVSYGRKQTIVEHVGRNAYYAIFDSGSTYSYFPGEAYSTLINSFNYQVDGLIPDSSDPFLPLCWQSSFARSIEDVRHLFEPLILHFGKRWLIFPTTFTIPPEGYLIINNKGNICLGILNGSEVHDGSIIILGDISLRGRLIVYDNVQQKIGWAESDCDKPQKPRDFPFLF